MSLHKEDITFSHLNSLYSGSFVLGELYFLLIIVYILLSNSNASVVGPRLFALFLLSTNGMTIF